MARFQLRYRRGVNIGRVVAKIAGTILSLYVGGAIVTEIGKTMTNTSSPFYKGLTLIGWTVGANPMYNASTYCNTCSTGCVGTTATTAVGSTCITSTSGSGILAVIGIIGIASIIMEFVEIRMK